MVAANIVSPDHKVPGVFHGFDDSLALVGLLGQDIQALILAQKISGGSAVADTPVLVSDAKSAATLFGAGSMADRMVRRFRALNRQTELTVIPLSDPGAGVQAVGTVTFSGSSSGGIYYFYVAGVQLQVSAIGTLTQIAQNFVDAVNAKTELPVDAVVNGGQPEQAILTAKNAGETGNAIDLRANVNPGETTPSGLTATIAPMAGGAGAPDLTAAIAAMADEPYHVIAFPYTDATSLTAIENELSDRFGPIRQLGGRAFAAASGVLAAMQALAEGRNSQFLDLSALATGPHWPLEYAAEVAAHVAISIEANPSVPFRGRFVNTLPPRSSDQWTIDERNTLLNAGASTARVIGGRLQIERLTSTRREDDQGAPTDAWVSGNLVYQLDRFRFEWNARMAARFGQHILVPDADLGNFDPGLPIVAPSLVRAESNALYLTLQRTLALVFDPDGFDEESLYEIDSGDPSRINGRLVPRIAGQLQMMAIETSFRLQAPA